MLGHPCCLRSRHNAPLPGRHIAGNLQTASGSRQSATGRTTTLSQRNAINMPRKICLSVNRRGAPGGVVFLSIRKDTISACAVLLKRSTSKIVFDRYARADDRIMQAQGVPEGMLQALPRATVPGGHATFSTPGRGGPYVRRFPGAAFFRKTLFSHGEAVAAASSRPPPVDRALARTKTTYGKYCLFKSGSIKSHLLFSNSYIFHAITSGRGTARFTNS